MSQSEPMLGVPIERLAEAMAHLAYFAPGEHALVLDRLGLDGDRYRYVRAGFVDLVARALATHDGGPLLTFSTAYYLIERRLRIRQPKAAEVERFEELVASGGGRTVPTPRRDPVPLPEKIVEPMREGAVALPSYLQQPNLDVAPAPPMPAPIPAIPQPLLAPPPPPPPAGVPAAAKPVASVAVGTMFVPDAKPAGPVTPFQTAQPDASGFSVSTYAKLKVELTRSKDAAAVLARHALDDEKLAALDKHWEDRMRKDSTVSMAFLRVHEEAVRAASSPPPPLKEEPKAAQAKSAATSTLEVAAPSRVVDRVGLAEHARLCAALAVRLEAPEALLERYKVSEQEKTALDAHYRALVTADSAALQTWQKAFSDARNELVAQMAERKA